MSDPNEGSWRQRGEVGSGGWFLGKRAEGGGMNRQEGAEDLSHGG